MKTIVQCTTFGQFGNALFQYCFARAYAERIGAVLETSYWVGERLFDIEHPRPSARLPQTMWDDIPAGLPHGIDLAGYFQNQEALSFYSRSKVKEWLQFKPEWDFPRKYKEYIAIHNRRGDYVTRYSHQFCLITSTSYSHVLQAIQKAHQSLPILVVSDEHPRILPEDPEISFLADFFTLMQASYLLRANSTFSWWAGTLGDGLVWSPDVGDLVGWNHVAYVPGNGEPLLRYRKHGRLDLKP